MSDKNTRAKFGKNGSPLPATRVMAKPFSPDHFGGGEPRSLLIINDNEGTYISANVYGTAGNYRFGRRFGRKYDPTSQTHPLPAGDDARWRRWEKDGYVEADVADFDVLALVETEEMATA